MNKEFYVYILTNQTKNVLYVGVTNNLKRRIFEHKEKAIEGFTKKYNVINLVYYEIYMDIENAIMREKNIKNWDREWKLKLIDGFNPEWEDLYYFI